MAAATGASEARAGSVRANAGEMLGVVQVLHGSTIALVREAIRRVFKPPPERASASRP